MRRPPWLPDWRDPAQYPDPKETTLPQWAWEFLRRNAEYQRLWRTRIKPFWDDADHSFDSAAAADQEAEDAITLFQRKFGIFFPLPPHAAASSPKFMRSFVRGRDYHPAAPEVRLTLRPGESFIIFDQAWPLAPQLERARLALEARVAYQKREHHLNVPIVKNHLDKFPSYLRVLDAEYEQVSQREMAAVIFPNLPNQYPDRKGEDAVRYSLDRARHLRDLGYEQILS